MEGACNEHRKGERIDPRREEGKRGDKGLECQVVGK